MGNVNKEGEGFRCEYCRILFEVKDAGGGLVCCGQPMALVE